MMFEVSLVLALCEVGQCSNLQSACSLTHKMQAITSRHSLIGEKEKKEEKINKLSLNSPDEHDEKEVEPLSEIMRLIFSCLDCARFP